MSPDGVSLYDETWQDVLSILRRETGITSKSLMSCSLLTNSPPINPEAPVTTILIILITINQRCQQIANVYLNEYLVMQTYQ